MKYLTLILALFFVGCAPTEWKLDSEEQKEETSVQVQEIALQDGTCYKVAVVTSADNMSYDVYLYNTETGLVEYKCKNETPLYHTLILILFLIVFAFTVVTVIINNL